MTNGNDIPQNSVCCKCGENNTLERDPDGDLHCWACGTDQKGKNPDAVARGAKGGTQEQRTEIAKKDADAEWGRMSERGRMNHQQIMERHKFYENNKQAILADVQSLGRAATWRKWEIAPASLHMLLARWRKPKEEPHKEVAVKTDERKARHKFYEENKDAIVADMLKMGRQPARRKWQIPKGILPQLIEKWLSPDQVAIMNHVEMPAAEKEDRQLPALPPFSALLDGPAQLKWLEIYEKLSDRETMIDKSN